MLQPRFYDPLDQRRWHSTSFIGMLLQPALVERGEADRGRMGPGREAAVGHRVFS